MRLRSVLLSALTLSIGLPVSAEPVLLRDAVRQAMAYSPVLAGAEARLEKGKAGVDAAKSAMGPTLGVQAQIGLSETDFTTDSITQEPVNAGLQAEWSVFTSGANRAAIDAALRLSKAAESGIDARREQIVLETVEAFANAWLAGKVIEVGQARIDTLKIRAKETESRFEQGLVTRTDTALTQSRLAMAEAQQAANQAHLALARARLERLTGLAGIEPLSPLAESFSLPSSFETALVDLTQSHPSIIAARQIAEAADFRLKEAEGRFGPKVSVKARAMTGEDMYFFFPDPITEFGAFVSVDMPLFTNGMKDASKRDALAGRGEALAMLREAELQLTEALAGAWGDAQARELSLTAAKQAEAAAALAAEGAAKEYEAGIRTLVDSLDAEDEFRTAQIERVQAETRLLISKARVLSLLTRLQTQLLKEG